jgi:probable F420-dependent oxidoreductase
LDAFGSPRGLHEAQQTARDVQEAGFAGLWIAEGARPALNLCGAAALAAPSLALGTGVAVAFARSPMVTAQEAWLLARATEGGFALGLGTQVKAHVERRYSAAFEHPGPRIAEYVGALRAIFRAFRGAEKLHYDGDFYHFSLLPDVWSPGPIDYPDPPIYLAGVRPWMCRTVGEVADGMYVHPLHTATYIESLVKPAVAEGAARSGRSADDVTLVCPVMTAVSDDSDDLEQQREELRARIAFYGSTPGYGIVFDVSGWPGVGERLNALQRAGDFAAMSATITDAMLDACAVTATWDELPAKLIERYAGKGSRLVCYSTLSQWDRDPSSQARWRDVTERFHALAGSA